MFLNIIEFIAIIAYSFMGIIFFATPSKKRSFSYIVIEGIILGLIMCSMMFYLFVKYSMFFSISIQFVCWLSFLLGGTYKLLKDGEYFNNLKEFLNFKVWSNKIKSEINSKS